MGTASTSRTTLIKEEHDNINERASNKDFEDSGASKLCSSSKCSCPEAVQYRKKYRLHLEQQQLKRQQHKSFVKKENDSNATHDNINGDNQINGNNANTISKILFHQERSSSVLQSG